MFLLAVLAATFAGFLAFVAAHYVAAGSIALVALSNFIVVATAHPDVVPDSALKYVKFAAQLLSIFTHAGSADTFKAPFTLQAAPPVSLRGFVRLPVLMLLAVLSLFVAAAAHAQEAPVPGYPTAAATDPIATYAPLGSGAVFTLGGKLIAQADAAPVAPVVAPAPAPTAPPAAAPADATPVTPTIGGCFASGKLCVGPSVAITLTAINLTTQHVEAGFSPGVGIGLTYQKGTWNSVGLGAYFNLTPGAGGVPDQAGGALIASFLNGWGRVGVSKGFLGDKSTRLLVGTGLDL